MDDVTSSTDSIFGRYTHQAETTVVGGMDIYNSQTFPKAASQVAPEQQP